MSFFGGGTKDRGVASITGYRQINTSCAGLDLSKPELDVPVFRKLLSCFNSYGALDPMERLSSKLSDGEIEPIVTVLNKYILNNQRMLYELEKTHFALERRKILDATFMQVGKFLENEEFITSVIALLREGYSLGDRKSILTALEKLAEKINHDNTVSLIDSLMTFVSSRSFAELQSRLRIGSPARRSLKEQAFHLLEYIKNPRHIETGKIIASELVNGDIFGISDKVFGSNSEDLRDTVPRTSSVLKVLLGSDGYILDGLGMLMQTAANPIWCLDGAKLANPGLFMLNELATQTPAHVATYIKRDNVLFLAMMNPFCGYPSELGRYYNSLVNFADTTAIEPAAVFLKALYGVEKALPGGKISRPLVELLHGLMADGEFTHLIPLMTELNDRNAWDDILLLLNLLRVSDREVFADAVRYVLETDPALSNRSIYDVFMKAVANAGHENFHNLLRGIDRFIDYDEQIVITSLRNIRSAFYVNDVHPMINIVHDLMAEATENESFFNSLFTISDMPEFNESLMLMSEISKDGRLKELLGALTTLFHKFAVGGKVAINEVDEPAFVPKWRHDFGVDDLSAFPIKPEPSEADASCGLIDLNHSLADYNDPGFQERIRNVLSCRDSDKKHGDIVDAVDFMMTHRMEDGRVLWNFQIDLLKKLNLSYSEKAFLMGSWQEAMDDGRFFRLIDASSFWVGRGHAAAESSVLRPLLDFLKPIIGQAKANLRRLELFAASVLRREDFFEIFDYIEKIIERSPEPPLPGGQSGQDGYDTERVIRWISNKECGDVPQGIVRAQQIIDDYENAVTTWDKVNGIQRRSWSKAEFKSRLNLVFDKIADPGHSAPERKLMESLLAFTTYFTLQPSQRPNQKQHYTPQYLKRWLYERSDDRKLMTYFFPGETRPRVRLVNTLDRLELLLINGDFIPPVPFNKNYGMHYLAQFAEAWGDEPRELWPDEIKRKFPDGKSRPKMLREVFEEISTTQKQFEDLSGFPDLPHCTQAADPRDPPDLQKYETTDPKAQGIFGFMISHEMKSYLFNSRQALSVIEENLPGSGTRFDGGMKVLRDLFFEVYYSTPEKYRTPKAGWFNNLSVIMRFVRMGVMHQAGKAIRQFEPDDVTLDDFFVSLTEGSASPMIRRVFNSLIISDGKRTLLWNVLDQIFDIMDSSDDRHLRQLAFYMIALGSQTGLIEAELESLATILEA
ncbi:MAG: hypothetical protein AABZ06_01690, partial [Bdellovibrionota bacterium]